FAGVVLELARRSARFDTLGWIAPHRALADVAQALEFDALVAPGYDVAQRASVLRYDAWMGRLWLPGREHVISADAWTSGVLGNVRRNQISRASLTGFAAARNGYWGAHALVEQIIDADPDTRVLTLA